MPVSIRNAKIQFSAVLKQLLYVHLPCMLKQKLKVKSPVQYRTLYHNTLFGSWPHVKSFLYTSFNRNRYIAVVIFGRPDQIAGSLVGYRNGTAVLHFAKEAFFLSAVF